MDAMAALLRHLMSLAVEDVEETVTALLEVGGKGTSLALEGKALGCRFLTEAYFVDVDYERVGGLIRWQGGIKNKKRKEQKERYDLEPSRLVERFVSGCEYPAAHSCLRTFTRDAVCCRATVQLFQHPSEPPRQTFQVLLQFDLSTRSVSSSSIYASVK